MIEAPVQIVAKVAPLLIAAAMLGEMDPISGGAGWVGTGLLGSVLAWLLLKHLPDKDKQLERLLGTKDGQITDAIKSHQAIQERSVDKFSENLGNALDTFSVALREERTTYQKWHEENRGRLDAIQGDLKEQRHHVTNLTHELGMKKLIEAKLHSEARARGEQGEGEES